ACRLCDGIALHVHPAQHLPGTVQSVAAAAIRWIAHRGGAASASGGASLREVAPVRIPALVPVLARDPVVLSGAGNRRACRPAAGSMGGEPLPGPGELDCRWLIEPGYIDLFIRV